MPETLTYVYIVLFFFGIYFLTMFMLIFSKNRKKLYDFPKLKKFPSISILVPALDEEDTIADTINYLLKIDYPSDKKEIIIINDGSKDKTKRIIEGFVKKNKNVFLLDKENSGKADSLNRGIKMAKGELIAVADADSYPNKDVFMKMVGHFEDKNVGAVTSRVLVRNKEGFLGKFQDIDYRVIAWSRKVLDYVNSVYVTNGPMSIYRKSILKEVGGFDTKNLTEDIEVTWHILSKGYHTRMSYDAKVYTKVPSKFKDWMNQRVRWNLGGLQTIYKYKSFFFRSRNAFGYFVIPYVSLAFFLAIVGFLLFSRFVWKKLSIYIYSIPFFLQGYNPFKYFDFVFPLTVLLILGAIFLSLSFYYYKTALRDSNRKSILNIIIYTLVYRPLYVLPLLVSIYRLIKGDIRWFTK